MRRLWVNFGWGHGPPTQRAVTWKGILFWILPWWCHTFALFCCCLVCPVHNCRLSKLQAFSNICHYMVRVKCRVHLKNYRNRPCRGLFTCPASARFLWSSQCAINLFWQGENISRTLPGHLSSGITWVLMPYSTLALANMPDIQCLHPSVKAASQTVW